MPDRTIFTESKIHFCPPCLAAGLAEGRLPSIQKSSTHTCTGSCRVFDECGKACECGGEHVCDPDNNIHVTPHRGCLLR